MNIAVIECTRKKSFMVSCFDKIHVLEWIYWLIDWLYSVLRHIGVFDNPSHFFQMLTDILSSIQEPPLRGWNIADTA